VLLKAFFSYTKSVIHLCICLVSLEEGSGIDKMLIKKEFDDASSVFFSTDVHGQKAGLDTALILAGYKRHEGHHLVLAGDSINGGPDSEGMIKKIVNDDNVFSVLGNHEAYVLGLAKHLNKFDFNIIKNYLSTQSPTRSLIDVFSEPEYHSPCPTVTKGREQICQWVYNGGKWFFEKSFEERMGLLKLLHQKQLPVALELTFPEGRIGVVHGTVPGLDWRRLQGNVSAEDTYCALWERGYIPGFRDKKIDVKSIRDVANIDAVVVGHTSAGFNPVRLGNTWCLDVGAKRTGRPAVMTAKSILDSVKRPRLKPSILVRN
jgi:hypothetical protein